MKTWAREWMGMRGVGGVAVGALLAWASGCANLEAPGEPSRDGDLRAVVLQRLTLDPLTSAGLYGVEVAGDEVILRGTVRSEAERMRVLSLVRGTPGVGRVTDRLRILP